MKDVSLHILDIVQNSVRAKATRVEIVIHDGSQVFQFSISDNGVGMKKEVVQMLENPYFTSRTTRKVGLGIPLLAQNARQSDGGVDVESEPGKGTVLKAWFLKNNIDCPPRGDLAEVVTLLMTGHPDVDFVLSYHGANHFGISSGELKEAVGEENFNHPRTIRMMKELIDNNLAELGYHTDY